MENRQGKNEEMSRRIWEIVETNTGKARVGKAEGGGSKGRSRKKMGEEG